MKQHFQSDNLKICNLAPIYYSCHFYSPNFTKILGSDAYIIIVVVRVQQSIFSDTWRLDFEGEKLRYRY